jgi:hypothetical protein
MRCSVDNLLLSQIERRGRASEDTDQRHLAAGYRYIACAWSEQICEYSLIALELDGSVSV